MAQHKDPPTCYRLDCACRGQLHKTPTREWLEARLEAEERAQLKDACVVASMGDTRVFSEPASDGSVSDPDVQFLNVKGLKLCAPAHSAAPKSWHQLDREKVARAKHQHREYVERHRKAAAKLEKFASRVFGHDEDTLLRRLRAGQDLGVTPVQAKKILKHVACRELIERLLVIAGIEENPGMASSARRPASADAKMMGVPDMDLGQRAFAQRTNKKVAGMKKTSEAQKSMHEAAARSMAGAAAADDARAEKRRQEKEKADAKELELYAGFEPATYIHKIMPNDEFYYVATRPEETRTNFLSILGFELKSAVVTRRCALTLAELDVPLVPCTVARVTFVGFEKDVEDGRLPQSKVVSVAPGHYTRVRFSVSHAHYGFLGTVVDRNYFECTCNMTFESLMLARQRRLHDGGLFDVVYQRVVGYRSFAVDYKQDARDPDSASYVSDCVFTSLLMLDGTRVRHSVDVASIPEHELSAIVMRNFSSDGPINGTRSVLGYQNSYHAIFKDRTPADVVSSGLGFVSRSVVDPLSSACATALKRAKANCVMAPISISRVVPCFADSFSSLNRTFAFYKRLAVPRQPPAEPIKRLMAQAAESLVRRMVPGDFDPRAIYEDCAETARSKKFTGQDLADYMDGAVDCLRTGGALWPGAPQTDEKRLAAFLSDPDAFMKQENMGEEKERAPRFIVAPNHYVRGFTHALFDAPQKTFFNCVRDISVKGLSSADRAEKVRSRFEACTRMARSDYTSMESHHSAWTMRNVELPVWLAACPRSLARTMAYVMSVYQRCYTISTDVDKGFLDPMMQSGKDTTSAANFILNYSGIFAILGRASGWDEDTMVRLPGSYPLPVIFEGDDALIGLRADIDARDIEDAIKQANFRLVFEEHDNWTEASFCSMRVAMAEGHPMIYRNVYSTLAKLTSLFSPDSTSVKQHLSLQIAKFASYAAENFHQVQDGVYEVPAVVGPFVAAGLRKYQSVAARVAGDVEVALAGGKVSAAAAFILDRYRLAKEDLPFAISFLKNRMAEVRVPQSFRALTQKLSGISPMAQELAESQLVVGVETGQTVIDCSPLADLAEQAPIPSKMTLVENVDARSVAKRISGPRMPPALVSFGNSVKDRVFGIVQKVTDLPDFSPVWAFISASLALLFGSAGWVIWTMTWLVSVGLFVGMFIISGFIWFLVVLAFTGKPRLAALWALRILLLMGAGLCVSLGWYFYRRVGSYRRLLSRVVAQAGQGWGLHAHVYGLLQQLRGGGLLAWNWCFGTRRRTAHPAQ